MLVAQKSTVHSNHKPVKSTIHSSQRGINRITSQIQKQSVTEFYKLANLLLRVLTRYKVSEILYEVNLWRQKALTFTLSLSVSTVTLMDSSPAHSYTNINSLYVIYRYKRSVSVCYSITPKRNGRDTQTIFWMVIQRGTLKTNKKRKTQIFINHQWHYLKSWNNTVPVHRCVSQASNSIQVTSASMTSAGWQRYAAVINVPTTEDGSSSRGFPDSIKIKQILN